MVAPKRHSDRLLAPGLLAGVVLLLVLSALWQFVFTAGFALATYPAKPSPAQQLVAMGVWVLGQVALAAGACWLSFVVSGHRRVVLYTVAALGLAATFLAYAWYWLRLL